MLIVRFRRVAALVLITSPLMLNAGNLHLKKNVSGILRKKMGHEPTGPALPFQTFWPPGVQDRKTNASVRAFVSDGPFN